MLWFKHIKQKTYMAPCVQMFRGKYVYLKTEGEDV